MGYANVFKPLSVISEYAIDSHSTNFIYGGYEKNVQNLNHS